MDDFARLNLIGESPTFLSALNLIRKYATSDATVLLQGETGTGKELAARAIHYLGDRRDFPFIPVNCGALPDNLVESELFGHVRGAFTDAKQAQAGLVAQARGGTLLLDEIESLSPRAQVALLRFLQEMEYRPLGGSIVKDADVRVIVSSNADLKKMVRSGQFRSDLLFRVTVLSLRIPPLRERRGDVEIIATAFLESLNQKSRGRPKQLHPSSVSLLNSHDWPGNVRELENLIQREYVLAESQIIRIESVSEESHGTAENVETTFTTRLDFGVAKAQAIAHFEKTYIAGVLLRTEGNVTLASQLSGKNRTDISRLIRKYGLNRSEFMVNRPAV